MKKILILFISCIFITNMALAKTDETSEAYLKNHKHFSVMNPVAETIVAGVIKSSINREAKGKYKVKISGYTLSSLKQGIFKYLEITGKNIDADGIPIPYAKIKTVTDYNWVDYNKEPVVFKSDIILDYNVSLSEDTINSVLDTKEYKNTISNINKLVYPFIVINDVNVKICNNKISLIFAYNFPLMYSKRDKTLSVTTGINVINGKIKLSQENYNNYKNAAATQITNVINMLDPLAFTANLLEDKKCKGKVEYVKIVDNIIQVNGRIYVEAD